MDDKPEPVDPMKPWPKNFRAICRKHYDWCADLSDKRLGTFKEKLIVILNCGKPVKLACDQKMKDRFRAECKKKVSPPNFELKVSQCVKTMLVLTIMDGCENKGGTDKRDAKLSGDDSSSHLLIWASLGLLLLLLICALVAWWYLTGGSKKGAASKGTNKAAKSGKSKMTAGKSKLGSRKTLGSKAASRKSFQRSKLSQQASKKSRLSGKKK